MNAAVLVLTHFSARYIHELPTWDRARHSNVAVAFDLLRIPIVRFLYLTTISFC